MDETTPYEVETGGGGVHRVELSLAAGVVGVLVGTVVVLCGVLWLALLYKLPTLPRTLRLTAPYAGCALVSGLLLALDMAVFRLGGVDLPDSEKPFSLCRMLAALHYCPLLLAMLLLLFLGIDRYLVIARPASYPDNFGPHKLTICFIAMVTVTTAVFFAIAATPGSAPQPVNATGSECLLSGLDTPTLLLCLAPPLGLLALVYLVMFFSVRHIIRIQQRRIQVSAEWGHRQQKMEVLHHIDY